MDECGVEAETEGRSVVTEAPLPSITILPELLTLYISRLFALELSLFPDVFPCFHDTAANTEGCRR